MRFHLAHRLRRPLVALACLLIAGQARAQEHPAGRRVLSPSEVIMPHITDAKSVEYPCFKHWEEWNCELQLPTWNVTVGSRTFDMGPTKHVVFLAIAGFFCILMLLLVARAHKRQSQAVGHPKGFAAGIEALMLLLR